MPRVSDKALDDLEDYFEHQSDDLKIWCMERGVSHEDVSHDVKLPEKEAFDLIADLREARSQWLQVKMRFSRALVAVRAYRMLLKACRTGSNAGVHTALDQIEMADVEGLLRE